MGGTLGRANTGPEVPRISRSTRILWTDQSRILRSLGSNQFCRFSRRSAVCQLTPIGQFDGWSGIDPNEDMKTHDDGPNVKSASKHYTYPKNPGAFGVGPPLGGRTPKGRKTTPLGKLVMIGWVVQ